MPTNKKLIEIKDVPNTESPLRRSTRIAQNAPSSPVRVITRRASNSSLNNEAGTPRLTRRRSLSVENQLVSTPIPKQIGARRRSNQTDSPIPSELSTIESKKTKGKLSLTDNNSLEETTSISIVKPRALRSRRLSSSSFSSISEDVTKESENSNDIPFSLTSNDQENKPKRKSLRLSHATEDEDLKKKLDLRSDLNVIEEQDDLENFEGVNNEVLHNIAIHSKTSRKTLSPANRLSLKKNENFVKTPDKTADIVLTTEKRVETPTLQGETSKVEQAILTVSPLAVKHSINTIIGSPKSSTSSPKLSPRSPGNTKLNKSHSTTEVTTAPIDKVFTSSEDISVPMQLHISTTLSEEEEVHEKEINTSNNSDKENRTGNTVVKDIKVNLYKTTEMEDLLKSSLNTSVDEKLGKSTIVENEKDKSPVVLVDKLSESFHIANDIEKNTTLSNSTTINNDLCNTSQQNTSIKNDNGDWKAVVNKFESTMPTKNLTLTQKVIKESETGQDKITTTILNSSQNSYCKQNDVMPKVNVVEQSGVTAKLNVVEESDVNNTTSIKPVSTNLNTSSMNYSNNLENENCVVIDMESEIANEQSETENKLEQCAETTEVSEAIENDNEVEMMEVDESIDLAEPDENVGETGIMLNVSKINEENTEVYKSDIERKNESLQNSPTSANSQNNTLNKSTDTEINTSNLDTNTHMLNLLISKKPASNYIDDDDGDSEEKIKRSEFIDDEALEVDDEEEALSDPDVIIDIGESIHSSESRSISSGNETDNSFIVEDEVFDLLSGEEYDLSLDDSTKKRKKKTKKSRIIKPNDSSDDEIILENLKADFRDIVNNETENPQSTNTLNDSAVVDNKNLSNNKIDENDIKETCNFPKVITSPISQSPNNDSITKSPSTSTLLKNSSITDNQSLRKCRIIDNDLKESLVSPKTIIKFPRISQTPKNESKVKTPSTSTSLKSNFDDKNRNDDYDLKEISDAAKIIVKSPCIKQTPKNDSKKIKFFESTPIHEDVNKKDSPGIVIKENIKVDEIQDSEFRNIVKDAIQRYSFNASNTSVKDNQNNISVTFNDNNTSVNIQENVAIADIKEELSSTIKNIVDTYYNSLKQTTNNLSGNISINLSLDYQEASKNLNNEGTVKVVSPIKNDIAIKKKECQTNLFSNNKVPIEEKSITATTEFAVSFIGDAVFPNKDGPDWYSLKKVKLSTNSVEECKDWVVDTIINDEMPSCSNPNIHKQVSNFGNYFKCEGIFNETNSKKSFKRKIDEEETTEIDIPKNSSNIYEHNSLEITEIKNERKKKKVEKKSKNVRELLTDPEKTNISYFPSNLLQQLSDNFKIEKKKTKLSSKNNNNAWNSELATIKPTSGRNKSVKSSFDVMSEPLLNDFKSKTLYDNSHVKRIHTKLFLKKIQK